MSVKIPIGKLLQQTNYVTEEQIQIALEVQKVTGGLLGEVLVKLAFVSPREIALAISQQSGKPYIDISEFPITKDALRIITKQVAKQLDILPLEVEANSVSIAMSDPFDINAIDILRRRTNLPLNIYVAEKESIQKSIEISYFLLEKPIVEDIKKEVDLLKKNPQAGNIPILLEKIINAAIIYRATDIHISPEETATHIFLRIDGVLRHFYTLPKEIQQGVVSRVKILGTMNIAEQRLPQDGSMSHIFFDEQFDIRISSVPSSTGENIVMRVLAKNLSLFNLESLGFEDKLLKRIVKQLHRSQGIVLVTGPTGSGKTTTLYSALRRVNSLQKRVITVENPIEYKFPFIKQTQVNEKAGYTFPSAMRAFLRQDPDIILVGEMRDPETAEMAMSAAITGHLVLSTMHTNDAATAIPRLIDLGIPNYLISAGVAAVIAQRLIRKNCSFCIQESVVTFDQLLDMGFKQPILIKHGITVGSSITVNRGAGCEHCGNTGYIGRVVICELLEVDEVIGDMVVKGATPYDIVTYATSQGMEMMVENGLVKIMNKVTTPEEVMRVLF